MSFTWKKLGVAVATAGLLAGALAACSDEREGDDTPTNQATDGTGGGGGELIGIAMPTKSLERWNRDGAHLDELLKEAGYKTSLQFADNKVDQQVSQIQNMINDGAKVLVIASIDGTALGPVLQTAADAGIKVIAYDRLINDTANVDYYATFDNYKVGQLQGEFIRDALDLEGDGGPYNFEPFAGSPDDNNAKFFFSGAWDILNQYVQSGKLVVQSGKAPATNDDWQSIGILGWGTDDAQAEMENRLNSFYTDSKVQVVLSPNDSLALGIAQALESAGYTPGEGGDWPVLTGQDADQANVLNMLAGKQSMTVWKDTRALGDAVAKMVDEIVTGAEVTVNDTDTYNNGVKNVPTLLLDPLVVTPDTVESALVESGFYSAEDLGL
ncbi:multiple monosaccharide ABC transporter substrate-binding protein [Cellulomonas composti]|uniref:Multiple sugar-binding periplasmic receptor ChvE n=1 Tax=Cellulomonas composti TaxID=266130 RepID=A0A511JBT1_9CELL|nr:multiple monosaccharide ABC transporter substrate-binding protein [Cellulomonas composti]GEL95451.1 multiple sugar-binding periplasmic receptor ChvE [Cellulomonas composti]